MPLSRNQQIAATFGANAGQYDDNAGLQARIAADLSHHLPRLENAKILEIGCGTGLFTEHLLGSCINCELFITDLSEQMLNTCQSRIGPHDNIHFIRCDGEKILDNKTLTSQPFDLIASSMTIQWFQHPVQTLSALTELLSPNGQLLYTTLGPDCFPEWRKVLEDLGIPSGTMTMPELPGIFLEQNIEVATETPIDFFKSLKTLGASTPRKGYTPMSAGTMRKALKLLQEKELGQITWHIVYGKLTSHF